MRLPDTLDIKSGAQDEPEESVTSDLLDFTTVKMLEMEEIEENMDDLLLNEIETKLQSTVNDNDVKELD